MDIKMGKLLLSKLIYNIKDKKAFTLVELSIVIVIIGLLVGGVVAGKSLVRGAQLQAVVSEFNKYNTAINTFQLQYNARPGDIRNAYDYWGPACGTNATVQTSVTGCNGNGNRLISFNVATADAATEELRAWQHMALAGLIEGSYIGTKSGQNHAALGVNTPASRLSGSGWRLYGGATVYGNANNSFKIGAPVATSGVTYINQATLSAKEASNIDRKIDDGAADTGRVLGINSWTTNWQTGCVTIGSGQLNKPAAYILDSSTSDQLNCALQFYGTF